MDGVDDGLEHGLKRKPGFVSVGREFVAYELGESGVGEVAGVDFLKADELLPAYELHVLSYRVGYCNAVIGRGGNNVAAAVGFAVRANEGHVYGVDDGLALDAEGPAGVGSLPGAGGEVIGQSNGSELAYGGGQRMGAGLELLAFVVRGGVGTAVSEGNRGDKGIVLGGELGAVSVFNDAGYELAVIGHSRGEILLLNTGIVLNLDLEQLSELFGGGNFNAALDADGNAVLIDNPLAVSPGKDELHLALRSGGSMGAFNEAIGNVILLGILGHYRGYGDGIDAVILGDFARGIAASYEVEVYPAVVYSRFLVVVHANRQRGEGVLIGALSRGGALSDELDLRILAIHELPAVVVVVDEAYDGVLIVRGVRAAAILGAELVNEVLGIKGDVAVVLPVLQLNGSDFIAGLVGIHESPVVLARLRGALDIDFYQGVDFLIGRLIYALDGELDLLIHALGELPAVVIDEGHSGVHVVRDVRAAAILGAELVNEVLGFKGDVADVLPEVIQRNVSDVIAGLVGIHESPVVRSSRRDAIDIDVYQLVDFISSGRFGRAHDLAGDGGIASDFPSFRLGAPGQHECPFGVVGVIMPVRDLLIIGGKNEAVIRLDGANARREVYNNNAVVQIQMETLVVVLGIFVDAVEVYGELIQLILGRVTGLVGRRLGLLCLVNRGGGRSGHFADGDGVTHGVTGVSVLHRVGVVNVHGVISRDIDSDVATAFASGNELKRAVLAANLDGAAAFPHGVGDNDVLGGDVVEAANGDSVLKHIANSGRPLVVGNGNGLVYVKLGHRLGLSGLALNFKDHRQSICISRPRVLSRVVGKRNSYTFIACKSVLDVGVLVFVVHPNILLGIYNNLTSKLGIRSFHYVTKLIVVIAVKQPVLSSVMRRILIGAIYMYIFPEDRSKVTVLGRRRRIFRLRLRGLQGSVFEVYLCYKLTANLLILNTAIRQVQRNWLKSLAAISHRAGSGLGVNDNVRNRFLINYITAAGAAGIQDGPNIIESG